MEIYSIIKAVAENMQSIKTRFNYSPWFIHLAFLSILCSWRYFTKVSAKSIGASLPLYVFFTHSPLFNTFISGLHWNLTEYILCNLINSLRTVWSWSGVSADTSFILNKTPMGLKQSWSLCNHGSVTNGSHIVFSHCNFKLFTHRNLLQHEFFLMLKAKFVFTSIKTK